MDYKRFGNTVIARIDRGEEVLEKLKEICTSEKIMLANLNALGAVGDFTVGVFKTAQKKYEANNFKGDFEIVSLAGTISTMNGEYYAHVHMSAGDVNGNVFGGHLNRAVVSATCEIVINVIEGSADRLFSDAVGLNLLKF